MSQIIICVSLERRDEMAEWKDEEEKIYQNLIDAGCDIEDTKICVDLYENKQVDRLSLVLKKQRKRLLDQLHCLYYQIESLDYLIFSLDKKNKARKKER